MSHSLSQLYGFIVDDAGPPDNTRRPRLGIVLVRHFPDDRKSRSGGRYVEPICGADHLSGQARGFRAVEHSLPVVVHFVERVSWGRLR